MLTMFRDAHTDARTHGRTGQKQYASGHTTLGGGMKSRLVEQKPNVRLSITIINESLGASKSAVDSSHVKWSFPIMSLQ